MKLRFEVDQADCFRRGIDCPKSIVSVEVKPAELSQEDRNLIADRLMGIDVWKLRDGLIDSKRIIAKEPTFEALMIAIRENQKEETK